LRSVRIKICGLTREKDLAAAVVAGADALGFLVGVPSSPRNLTIERAKTLLKQVPVFVDRVVVTAPKNIEELVEISKRLKPSAIQIHGKEPLDFSKVQHNISNTQLIKTVYITEDTPKESTFNEIEIFDAILLDSFSKGQYGGTGKVHDWTLSRQIKKAIAPTPVILAGGLNPENIKEAILAVEPYAVDVASGIEANPGEKDHKKIQAFIQNAKQIKLSNN
jgi:phosphoribosylanthranilate isomerase